MSPVTHTELLAHDYPLALAQQPDGSGEVFSGSCPCAIIHGDSFKVETHCWRSSCESTDHPFSCIHVTGSLPKSILQQIAEHIRDNNGWTNHTDWNITVHEQ